MSSGAPEATRILLADDHALVRRGIRLILDSEPGLTVVAEAGDGKEAVDLARSVEIDLAILDIAMPRMTGLQAARELSSRASRPADSHADDVRQRAVLLPSTQGRSGGVCAEVGRRPRPGGGVPCGDARGAVPLPGSGERTDPQLPESGELGQTIPEQILTAREEEVLKLVAEGHSSKEIAETLFISVKTVERHRANMLQKLGLRDRLELTRYAIRAGLIEP